MQALSGAPGRRGTADDASTQTPGGAGDAPVGDRRADENVIATFLVIDGCRLDIVISGNVDLSFHLPTLDRRGLAVHRKTLKKGQSVPEKIPERGQGEAREKAASAFGVNPHFEEEAKARMSDAGKKSAPGRPAEKGKEIIPDLLQARDHAASAFGVNPHFEEEAKKRLATSTGGKTPRPVEKIPEAEEGRSRDQAASAFGVNPHYEAEARKRMLAGVKSDPPEKIPGGATGDARDHAARAALAR
ncbi:hypothetical protein K0B90_03135 [bacterium]|nr:hypothetical protein [bacterium]